MPHIEIIARGLILAQGHILLCRNVAKGYRYLPGGHVEFSEPAARAVERELVEECGLRVRTGTLALITEERFNDGRKDRHELNLVFHVEHSLTPTSPGTTNSVQSLEPEIAFDWVARSDLASAQLQPPSIRRWLMAAPDSTGLIAWLPSA